MIFYDATERSYSDLYFVYSELSRHYPGWSLAEVRSLTARERRHFMETVIWRMRVQHSA